MMAADSYPLIFLRGDKSIHIFPVQGHLFEFVPLPSPESALNRELEAALTQCILLQLIWPKVIKWLMMKVHTLMHQKA